MPIPDEDMRKIKTYIGELKLAGYRVHWYEGLLSRTLRRPYEPRKYPRIKIFNVDLGRRGVIILFYIPTARKRHWRVESWRAFCNRQSYEYLDTAMDAISQWLREHFPIPQSGVADG